MRSQLCIFNVETGEDRILTETDMLIEAPNWHPDDTFLIVNGEGHIFRIDFDQPNILHKIDTDFAVLCNNDHGISPDGMTLVISLGADTSTIYTLPIEGGRPKRITNDEPSYWHGWSPDGKMLAYVGRSQGPFQVFTVPVDGGEPVQLTHGGGHKDGPDYTPDGNWIWFNSDRGGHMDLWRMRPADGSDLEQMTNDDAVNWFPHPSPDGKHVLYLAYENGTEGHPRDRNVRLMLMPSEGGEARTLKSLFGGQGTINVPCWAPDSKRFAYVQYMPAI